MIYADLHIHIGQSLDGKAVKITASKSLTLPMSIKFRSRAFRELDLKLINAYFDVSEQKWLFCMTFLRKIYFLWLEKK